MDVNFKSGYKFSNSNNDIVPDKDNQSKFVDGVTKKGNIYNIPLIQK